MVRKMGTPTEKDVSKVVRLLSVASTAIQINKLAAETKPPAKEAAALARGIAVDVLRRAKALLG